MTLLLNDNRDTPSGLVTATSIVALNTPWVVQQGDPIGTLIGEVELVPSTAQGAGAWTKTSGTKHRVATTGGSMAVPVSGRRIRIELAAIPAAGDVGTGKTAPVTYTEGATVLNLSPTYEVQAPTAVDSVTWRSGFCTVSDNNNAIQETLDVAAWRNRPCKIKPVYTRMQNASGSWASLASDLGGTTSHLQWCADNDVLPMFDAPICDGIHTGDFKRVADGLDDASIRTVATKLRAIFGTTKPCNIVLGREGNSVESSPWYWGRDTSTGKANLKAAIRQIISVMKETGKCDTPNYGFQLTLQKDPKGGCDIYSCWPGNDAGLTHLGFDYYDATGTVSTAANYATWKTKIFNNWVTPGRSFGVKLIMAEWGLRHLEYNGGCDNKYFIQNMKKLFVELSTGHTDFVGEAFFRINKLFLPGKTPAYYNDSIHSICYYSGANIVSGTPFNGPGPLAGGAAAGGTFVGSVAGTTFAATEYLKELGG